MTPPPSPDLATPLRCERCGYCAGCHAATGHCPAPNTTCVLGNQCGQDLATRLHAVTAQIRDER